MKAFENKREIKAVFLDIDGTLFSHTMKKIPDSTVKALNELKEKGVCVFLATGRAMGEIEGLNLKDIEVYGYIALNGHMCYDKERKLIYSLTIEDEDAAILKKLFAAKKVPMCIVEKDDLYINFVNEKVEEVLGAVTTAIPPVKEYQGGEIYQFIIYCSPEEGKEWIKDTKRCKIHYWHKEGADILHIDSGKAASIAQMLDLYKMDREEIMVFGDGENDIDMITYAGIGIAMGNALESVKQYADYVTDHIDEDGIWNALKYFEVL